MERAAIKIVLHSIFEETRGDKVAELDEQTNLREGLGFDSVDFVCMVLEVQNRLGVNLTISEMEPVVRVADLLDVLESRMSSPLFRAA
jgi:acyl carrier protein